MESIQEVTKLSSLKGKNLTRSGANYSLLEFLEKTLFFQKWSNVLVSKQDGTKNVCGITGRKCTITKTYLHIVKLVLTGVYIIILLLLKNIDCGYSLEPPRRGGSIECPQSMFWAGIWKILNFLSENFRFLVVKFSVYLNRRVFVMTKRM